jgi:hypothetical protein
LTADALHLLKPFQSVDDLRVLRRLGTASKHPGQLDEALTFFTWSLEIARKDGAGTYSTRKDFVRSFQLAREAAEEIVADSLSKIKGPRNEPLDSPLQMAFCQIYLNNPEQADILLHFLQECYGAHKQIRQLARLESNLANTALLRNNSAEARRRFKRAMELALVGGALTEHAQINAQLRQLGA